MEENTIENVDYLKEIRDINKKRLFWTKVSVALVAILLVCVVTMVPVAIKTMNRAQTTLSNADEALAQAQVIMSDLNVAIDSMEGAVDSITKLVDDSSEELVSAFENINSIDFEGLNQAIVDLEGVVKPLSNLFGGFR